MKIGFTGTRKYNLTQEQVSEIRDILQSCKVTEVHHGDCVGSDAAFHEIAKVYGTRIVIHPPLHDKYRAYCVGDVERAVKPYLQRNHDIVNAVDLMIACPQTASEELRSGTWATIRYAKKVGKDVRLVLGR